MRELIEGCIKKERSSCKQLYDKFSAKMLTICRIYTRNSEDARDVFQTGFIRIFENIAQLKEPDALEWWMKRIFINESILLYKKNARYLFDETMISDTSDKREVGDKMDGEAVLQEVQKLPMRMRQVFCMYVLDGFSHKEIAEKLGISEGTSKSNLHDARNVLRKRVSNLYSISETTLQE